MDTDEVSLADDFTMFRRIFKRYISIFQKEKTMPFHEMGLDDRILKAIAKLGWTLPTLIQERAIPLIIEGKDLFF